MNKELHYEGNVCSRTTPCPYFKEDDPKLGVIQIGSCACHDCPHFVSDDAENWVVICSHE